MSARAAGKLPDMGCALRVAQVIEEHWSEPAGRPPSILDVGCATGHFRRTFERRGLPVGRYVGLEIDPAMVRAATTIWGSEIASGKVAFINEDLERFDGDESFDIVICVNAFMYFASAKKALANLLRAARGGRLFVRSYFADDNYRIIRAQTKLNHDKARLSELEVFDDDGNMLSYDYWNIYSRTYIEQLVALLAPTATVAWLEDRNVVESIEQERGLNIKKRGATEVMQGCEVSYPFILPWKYLSVDMTGRRPG
jgi:SAM-dependent methyltransferase